MKPPHRLATRTAVAALAGLSCLLALQGTASAQAYPTRPVTLIINQETGGPTDLFGRALGKSFAERTGQGFIVEDRPGAPREAVAKLATEIATIVKEPGFQKTIMVPFGYVAIGNTPEEFAKFIAEDRKDGALLAKLAGDRLQ